MSSERIQATGLLAVLVATGALAFWLSDHGDRRLDVATLEALPAALSGWRAVDVPLEQDVADMLRADAHVQRAYLHPLGYVVHVYIGYYGTERGGTPEHTPDVCYPAQGWAIRASSVVAVGGQTGFDVREFLVEKEGERQLVHYWYQTRGQPGILSTGSLRWHHFWGRLRADRADGALVRLSTPIEGDAVDAARQKLQLMDLAVEAELSRVWPRESIADDRA
jgi:EpsI family protein